MNWQTSNQAKLGDESASTKFEAIVSLQDTQTASPQIVNVIKPEVRA